LVCVLVFIDCNGRKRIQIKYRHQTHTFFTIDFCIVLLEFLGSIFELFGGSPQLGVAGTASVALLGTPLCIFLFYASVLKGNAETEEDDKKFLKDRY